MLVLQLFQLQSLLSETTLSKKREIVRLKIYSVQFCHINTMCSPPPSLGPNRKACQGCQVQRPRFGSELKKSRIKRQLARTDWTAVHSGLPTFFRRNCFRAFSFMFFDFHKCLGKKFKEPNFFRNRCKF